MKLQITIAFLIAFIAVKFDANAENLKQLINLEGTWKFTIGDDQAWAEIGYDDREWDYLRVPGSWEKNGFINYDGYAWYRKSFQLNKSIDKKFVFLLLGYIDDVDEVYLNGHLIGSSGVFPPLVKTAVNILRKYSVPVELLKTNGENIIAIRIFDDYHDGGIINGPVGLYYDEDNDLLKQDLSGYWNFETINNYTFDHKPVYGQEMGMIYVPGHWESQGYVAYDGGVNYSTTFQLHYSLNPYEELMLVLGYIDDYDKVYINDKKIGSIEEIAKNRDKNEYYRVFRGYEIPAGLLNKTGTNELVVKVYDTWEKGGIYAGPIGITTIENFKTLTKNQKPIREPDWYDVIKSIFE